MTRTVSRREMLAWALAITLAVTAVTLTRGESAGAGATGPTTDVVYIATGANFPDALGAAATAAMGLGPVLLVQQDSIPPATLTELNRLQPGRIVIMGGTAVVDTSVESALEALPWGPDVDRIGGANRFETAADLSAATFPTTGMYPRAEHASSTTIINGTGSFQTLFSVTVEAPAPGLLIMHGDMNMFRASGSGNGTCRLTDPDADEILAARNFDHGDGNRRENCSITSAQVVDAGTYTINLNVNANADVEIWGRDLVVTWIPFDGMGAPHAP